MHRPGQSCTYRTLTLTVTVCRMWRHWHWVKWNVQVKTTRRFPVRSHAPSCSYNSVKSEHRDVINRIYIQCDLHISAISLSQMSVVNECESKYNYQNVIFTNHSCLCIHVHIAQHKLLNANSSCFVYIHQNSQISKTSRTNSFKTSSFIIRLTQRNRSHTYTPMLTLYMFLYKSPSNIHGWGRWGGCSCFIFSGVRTDLYCGGWQKYPERLFYHHSTLQA